MLEKRRGASGIVLAQSVLWIVGGRDGKYSGLNSSEFIQIGKLKILNLPPFTNYSSVSNCRPIGNKRTGWNISNIL